MRSIKSRGGLTRGRGITESVRTQWIYSMHECAGVHDAMTTLTGLKSNTSEQHTEIGSARSERDNKDLTSLQEWFDAHEPFDGNEKRLKSLSSGLTASEGDGISCDKTEEMGSLIHKQLDDKIVSSASIKRNDQIKSLEQLSPGVKIENEKLHINPNILFSRLAAILQREDDMEPYLGHELTAIPTSLFKDSNMRKPVKATVAQTLLKDVPPSQHIAANIHVIDGGALLHNVKWLKKSLYRDIVMLYVQHVRVKYGYCYIIFDGYEHPSIKDHEHQRRTSASKTCADILLNENMRAHHNQEMFLSNSSNKKQLISLMKHYLEKDGQTVFVSDGHADTLIVEHALQIARQERNVNVVADDTDILVLLLHHWHREMGDIFFQSTRQKAEGPKVFNISHIVEKVGHIVCANILFIHAWGGCDTTSATYGHGKTVLLRKIPTSERIQEISAIFQSNISTADEIEKAGNNLYVLLYGGNVNVSLNKL